MNRNEIIENISKETKSSISLVSKIIESFEKQIATALARDENVNLFGFGEFRSRSIKSKLGFNPIDNKEFFIPPKKEITFRQGSYISKLIDQEIEARQEQLEKLKKKPNKND